MKIWQVIILIMMILKIILFIIVYTNIIRYRKYNYMTKAAKYYKRRYDIINAFYFILFFSEMGLVVQVAQLIDKVLNNIFCFLESMLHSVSNKTYDLLFKKYEPEYEEQDYKK